MQKHRLLVLKNQGAESGCKERTILQSVKVFISYAREDYSTASEIFEFLSSLGVDPWMDKKSLLGGQDWDRSIRTSVRDCDFFLFCASPRSVSKRGAVQREIKLALKVWEEKLEDDIYFLPVRLEPCELPESISKFQWIDYFEGDSQSRLKHSLFEGMRLRAIVAPANIAIASSTKVISEENENCSFDIRYPVFSPKDAIGISDTNAVIETFAKKAAQRFFTTFSSQPPSSAVSLHSASIDYEITLESADLISIRFNEYVYTGGAHPNSNTRTFNFFRSPWYEFDLGFLALPLEYDSFVSRLNELCLRELRAQFLREGYEHMIGELEQQFKPDPEYRDYFKREKRLQRFYLSPNGIGIIFDPYEVGSYSMGSFEVMIAVTEVEELLRFEVIDSFKKIQK